MPASDPKVRARLLATACFAFFIVGGLGRIALGDALTAWDQQVLAAVAGARLPAVTALMKVLSAVGAGEVAIPIGLIVTWLLVLQGERRAAQCYAWTTLSGWALNIGLKELFQRPRPHVLPHLDQAGGFSYPSGHAMLAPLVFGLGGFLLTRHLAPGPRRIARGAAGLFAVAIGFSRIYLAVHYPSDVIGALLAGTGWAALGVAAAGPLGDEPTATGAAGTEAALARPN